MSRTMSGFLTVLVLAVTGACTPPRGAVAWWSLPR